MRGVSDSSKHFATSLKSAWCDVHYMLDDCVVVPPPAPAVPGWVYVVLCVYTKAVAINGGAGPATQPISGGRMAIFNRPQITTEERLGVEIVALTITRGEAEEAVRVHRAARPDLGADYEISEQTIGLKQSLPESATLVTNHPCILCGVPGLPLNRSFCDRCEADRNAALRSRDLDLIVGPQP